MLYLEVSQNKIDDLTLKYVHNRKIYKYYHVVNWSFKIDELLHKILFRLHLRLHLLCRIFATQEGSVLREARPFEIAPEAIYTSSYSTVYLYK